MKEMSKRLSELNNAANNLEGELLQIQQVLCRTRFLWPDVFTCFPVTRVWPFKDRLSGAMHSVMWSTLCRKANLKTLMAD